MKPIELKPDNPFNITMAGYAANSKLTAEDLGVLWKLAALAKGLVDSAKVFHEICEHNEPSLKKMTDMGVIKIKPTVDHQTKQVVVHVMVDLHPRLIGAEDIDIEAFDKVMKMNEEHTEISHERHITEDPADNAG